MNKSPEKDKQDLESQAAEVASRNNRSKANENDEGDQSDNEEGDLQHDQDFRRKNDDKKIKKSPVTKKDKLIAAQEQLEGIFLYKPGVELPNLFPFLQQQIKIIIAGEYINKRNPEFIKKNVCGNEAYTSNSDAVCMAAHSGFVNINAFNTKKFDGIQLTCKVVRPKKNYLGVLKNGISSKGIKNYDGNALKPESVRNLPTLPPMSLLERYAMNMNIQVGAKRTKSRPKCLSSIVPIPETHIVFNMNNQPAYKYSIFNIADKGFDKNELVIKKLDHYALYLQTDNSKYELTKYTKDMYFDFIKLSRIKHPEKADNDLFTKVSAPLPAEMVEVLEEGVEWDQVVLGNSSIKVRDEQIQPIRSFKYYRIESKK